MLDLFVIIFVGLMVYAWSRQGLFSSVIHLVVTIVAGALAFAFWEPVTSMLEGSLGDSAWGAGLLLPFAVFLYAIRTLTNIAIPGNLNFHHLAETIGGGFFGFLSGVLTIGLLVIGLMMTGVGSLFGYQPWVIDKDGKPTQKASLALPADSIAASFFTSLSSGPLAPLLSPATLASHHPNLVQEAAFYLHPYYDPEEDERTNIVNRKTAPADSISLVKDGFILLKSPPDALIKYEQGPPYLKVLLNKDLQTAIVGTDIQITGDDGAGGDGGRLRVRQFQASLLWADHYGNIRVVYPHGFIQNEGYGSFMHTRNLVVGNASQKKETIHWVFQIPPEAKPMYLRIKQVRLPLAEIKPIETPEAIATLVKLPDAVASDNKEPIDIAKLLKASNRLPFTINKNLLTNVQVEGRAIISGSGMATRADPTLGNSLKVEQIHAASDRRIYRLEMGIKGKPGLLTRSLTMTNVATPPAPVIFDENGNAYTAIGYGVDSGASYKFNIDPNNPIENLSSVDPGTLGSTDTLLLYYSVPRTTLTHVKMGPLQFDLVQKND